MQNKKLWTVAITFALLNAAMSLASARVVSHAPTPTPAPPEDPLVRNAAAAITNFHVVDDDKVYRGARPDAAGISALHDLLVKTDIDLQGGGDEIKHIGKIITLLDEKESKTAIKAEQDAVEHWADMAFVSKPLISTLKVDEAEEVKIDEVLSIMHDPKRQPVFVHCTHGNDRTGMIVALYRVKYDGWTIKQAHREMVQDGHRGFWDFLATHPMDTYFYKESKRILVAQKKQTPTAQSGPAYSPGSLTDAVNAARMFHFTE